MNERDRILIGDMLQAAREAILFARGRQQEDVRSDRMLTLALIKEIEIIGEAASKISADLKNSSQSIPWIKNRKYAESTDPCVL
jgi:uncharacterized protein with HEPN domain